MERGKAIHLARRNRQVVGVNDGTPKVSYTLGYTKNLDNFESLKISATVTIPIDADAATLARVEKTLVVAKSIVVKRLSDDLNNDLYI